jgi:hypothetical protein
MRIFLRLLRWLFKSSAQSRVPEGTKDSFSISPLPTEPTIVFTAESVRPSIDRWLETNEAKEIRRAFTLMEIGEDYLASFLLDYERQLGLNAAPAESLSWWEAVAAAYAGDQLARVCVAEAITSRRLTLSRFSPYLAAHGTSDFGKCLAIVDIEAKPNQSVVDVPREVTDSSGWTDEEVTEQLQHVKAQLDWEHTIGSARKWWEAFENENRHRLALVLRLLDELASRRGTITEFFVAYVYSNTDNIQANLHYMDYKRIKNEEEMRRKAPSLGEVLTPPAWPPVRSPLPVGISDTNGRTEEAMQAKLDETLRQLDWDNTTDSARKLWKAFETENKLNTALAIRLAEEIKKRNTTVTEFLLRCENSNTKNIQANLDYFDYFALKEVEERNKYQAAYPANRQKLGVDAAPANIREWWEAQERRHENEAHVLHEAAHELVEMSASVTECFDLQKATEGLENLLGVVERLEENRKLERGGLQDSVPPASG